MSISGLPVSALRFAISLPSLLVAHNVGDHVVQTDHQAAHKAVSWPAMAGHVGSYTAVSAAALAVVGHVTGVSPSLKRTVAGLMFSAVTHAFIDRRWPVRKLLRATGSAGFADMTTPLHGPYLADQALHHGCLLLAALIMAGE